MTSETEAQHDTLTTSRLLEPASPHERSSDDEASLGYLVRQAFSRSVDQIAQHEPGVRSGVDPEDVHQFRVGLRRLHSDLRTFAPLMRSRPRRGLGKELRWLGGAVGPVRDGDVLAKALEADARRFPRADPHEVILLSARLAEQHDSARAIMLEELDSDRFRALRATVRDFAEMPPVRSKFVHRMREPASEVAAEFVKKPWHELDADVERLGTAPSDASLHRVRILVKRCRYAAEAVGPAVAGAAEFAKALAGVQTVLGDHHDTVVAEAWLAEAVRDSPELARLAYDLILRQRSKRARSRAKWPTAWKRASTEELRAWL